MRTRFKPFNNSQLERISEITSNIGLIFFVSMALPSFNSQIMDWVVSVFGTIASFSFWLISLIIIKGVRNG